VKKRSSQHAIAEARPEAVADSLHFPQTGQSHTNI